MRRSLPRSGTSPQLLLLGSISVHGIWSDDLSRQPARHCRLFVRQHRSPLPDGVSGPIRRSTLADANEQWDWRIYAQLAQTLIRKARRLYANEPLAADLDATAYALDSTTIDLCLNLFRWAQFRRTKGAIKLHTLLDLLGPIPTFIYISDGKLHDVNALDLIPIEAGSFYIMDRGYLDFERLHTFQDLGAFFITRAKRSFKYVRLLSQEVNLSTGVRSDQIIRLKIFHSQKGYPDRLRRVRYFDDETQRFFVYLTNNFTLPPMSIALLYKSWWQVELFFKWIKPHLRIKAFYGTSENAVKSQIWIAVSMYVLIAIVRKRLGLDMSLYQILQILSVTPFEKMPILQALETFNAQIDLTSDCNQLNLFDF